MARPSNKEKRSEEILNAYEWCVARYGVEGATLDKVADQAQLARALIRHHIGNKDLLLELLVEKMIDKSNQSLKVLINLLPNEKRTETLINYLFDPQYSDQQMILVFSALITAANDKIEIADRLNQWANNFINEISNQILFEYSDVDDKAINAISSGVTGIYFNVDSLSTLGDIDNIRASSKEAALILVNSLIK